jgi:hypothetical protein
LQKNSGRSRSCHPTGGFAAKSDIKVLPQTIA